MQISSNFISIFPETNHLLLHTVALFDGVADTALAFALVLVVLLSGVLRVVPEGFTDPPVVVVL